MAQSAKLQLTRLNLANLALFEAGAKKGQCINFQKIPNANEDETESRTRGKVFRAGIKVAKANDNETENRARKKAVRTEVENRDTQNELTFD